MRLIRELFDLSNPKWTGIGGIAQIISVVVAVVAIIVSLKIGQPTVTEEAGIMTATLTSQPSGLVATQPPILPTETTKYDGMSTELPMATVPLNEIPTNTLFPTSQPTAYPITTSVLADIPTRSSYPCEGELKSDVGKTTVKVYVSMKNLKVQDNFLSGLSITILEKISYGNAYLYRIKYLSNTKTGYLPIEYVLPSVSCPT